MMDLAILKRHGATAAIVALPPVAFVLDRGLTEIVASPPFYALYVLCIAACATTLFDRLPPTIPALGSGALGLGMFFAVLVGIVGLFVAFIGSAMVGGWKASLFQRLGGLILIAVSFLPWLMAVALGQVAAERWRSSARRAGAKWSFAAVAVGFGGAAAAMILAYQVDAKWLAPRVEAFEANDPARWEQALRDIKGNRLCGHRRCLMSICNMLAARFGQTSGQCSNFACPFGFALETPNVPATLSAPFERVYGYSAQQVCVRGD